MPLSLALRPAAHQTRGACWVWTGSRRPRQRTSGLSGERTLQGSYTSVDTAQGGCPMVVNGQAPRAPQPRGPPIAVGVGETDGQDPPLVSVRAFAVLAARPDGSLCAGRSGPPWDRHD